MPEFPDINAALCRKKHAPKHTPRLSRVLTGYGKSDGVATKHWRHPSQLALVREGLKDLVGVVSRMHITAIALPRLGCAHGGLDWTQVRREIEGALAELPDVDITVFEPTDRYQNAPKRTGVGR